MPIHVAKSGMFLLLARRESREAENTLSGLAGIDEHYSENSVATEIRFGTQGLPKYDCH